MTCNGVMTTYSYDAASQLLSLVHQIRQKIDESGSWDERDSVFLQP